MSGIRGVFQVVRTVVREVRREGIQGFLSRMTSIRNTPALPESNEASPPPKASVKDSFTRLKERFESTEATFVKLKKQGFTPSTFAPSASNAEASASTSTDTSSVDTQDSTESTSTEKTAFMVMTGRNASIEKQVLISMISVQEHAETASDALNKGPKGDSKSYRKEVVLEAKKSAENTIKANKGITTAIHKGEKTNVDTTSLKDNLAKGEAKLTALLNFIKIVESRDMAMSVIDLHDAQDVADGLKKEKNAPKVQEVAHQAVKLSKELDIEADALRDKAKALKADGEDKKVAKLNKEAAAIESRTTALRTLAELANIQYIAIRAQLADEELD